MRLNVLAFSLACALIWGFGLFCLTWWIIAFEGQTGERTIIGLIYRGYSISAGGSFIGLLWGLGDGFIGGAIFAWLYNKLRSLAPPVERTQERDVMPMSAEPRLQ